MFAFSSQTTCALLALSAFASASAVPKSGPGNFAASLGSKCSVAAYQPSMPSGQTNISIPSGTPMMVALGVGVQNYTCASTGTYSSTGAVAELFDASCFVNQSFFSSMTSTAFQMWNASDNVQTTQVIEAFSSSPVVFGQHYFIQFNGVLSPTFDARAGEDKGDPNAFSVMSKTGSLNAPTGSADVPWLQLANAGSGNLTTGALRMATTSGQPPASCSPGSEDISVKYTAQYWLYN